MPWEETSPAATSAHAPGPAPDGGFRLQADVAALVLSLRCRLVADIFLALGNTQTETVMWGVDATESLTTHPDARGLLIRYAPRLLEALLGHVVACGEEDRREEEEQARLRRERAAAGGDAAPAPAEVWQAGSEEAARMGRRALMMHTLFCVAKEADIARPGSAWPLLHRRRSDLLPVLLRFVGVGQSKVDWDASFHSELMRNVLVILAELTDPLNCQGDRQAGADFALALVEAPGAVQRLLDIMQGPPGAPFVGLDGPGLVQASPRPGGAREEPGLPQVSPAAVLGTAGASVAGTVPDECSMAAATLFGVISGPHAELPAQ